MYQGGDAALQAACGRIETCSVHQPTWGNGNLSRCQRGAPCSIHGVGTTSFRSSTLGPLRHRPGSEALAARPQVDGRISEWVQATALATALALALTDGRCCPVVPDDYSGHLAVKDALKSLPTMLATAEHEYTRYGYKQLIDSGAVDVLQPDITWLGGITEVRFPTAHRVLWLAQARGKNDQDQDQS